MTQQTNPSPKRRGDKSRLPGPDKSGLAMTASRGNGKNPTVVLPSFMVSWPNHRGGNFTPSPKRRGQGRGFGLGDDEL